MPYVFFDCIITFFSIIYGIASFVKNKKANKLIELQAKVNDSLTPPIDNAKNKKVLAFLAFLYMIIGLLIIGIGTSFIWIPIIISFKYGGKIAYFVFTILFIMYDIPVFIFADKHPEKVKFNDGNGFLSYTMLICLFDLMIIVLFPEQKSLISIMEITYNIAPIFKNTFTILMPILIIASIITNIYLVVEVLLFIYDKGKGNIQKRIKLIDFFIIFIAASFIGLLFISEQSYPFISTNGFFTFSQTLDIFKLLLTAILIPLIIKRQNSTSKPPLQNKQE